MLEKKLSQGLVHIYTGDGKGKTTAALGQAFRAAGWGYKVYMIQFLKGGDSGELHTVERLEPDFKIFRFDDIKKFFWTLNAEEKEAVKRNVDKAFAFAEEVVQHEKCNLLILDEIMGVLSNKLLTVEQVCNLIRNKPDSMELILTGRNVPSEIVALADYVSEIKMIKHPFQKGIGAREGIEH
ncbi:cob(I)yrinic acid a,c-diamide adenosyltransferase [Thermotalea metallivorans]|uniref:Cob(I)yrinic acid a,c-diamide adenosyltransferase n=1 Tax=Thermotalea metallivorans TaxID=520762 RepID=A0A140LEF1_9FIRM|nr:cob(I)yrinic acid a,c-diamide adenosyltransferase [Thermotalea metallivorans]KXG78926.1 Cob(I)yrinic acid a,c-diamide adenosyltransferase [Thermotalea metallivorans]